jgi:hypothetical protein
MLTRRLIRCRSCARELAGDPIQGASTVYSLARALNTHAPGVLLDFNLLELQT